MMKPIWIVDDDQSIRWVLEKALSREKIPHRSFSNPNDVLNALEKESPEVLISDIRMPRGNGLDLLQHVKASHPNLPVIIMTAYSDLESAVSSFQGGAFEYLPKPFDVDEAVSLVKRANQHAQEQQGLDVPQNLARTPEIIGEAPAMQEVFRAIGRLSHSNITVLINGESGTGKELVAHALHRHSPRAAAPFIALNMAAIPKDLMESELFGHEKGAFTGAANQRRGRFEQADGGTLFLDEIGDMPADTQTRLLRVLADGEFYRVGGHTPVKVDVRIIAATHQNLETLVQAGKFREDLFHRLNVIRLRLPALRERHEDVPVLTRHFLQQSARQLGVEPKRIADSAIARLEQFAFPGNVRQLENICHWLTVMAPAQVISLQDLPPEVLEAPLYQPAPRPGSDPSAAVAAVHAVAAPMPTPAPAVELVGGLPQPATVATQPLVGGIAASATPALGATPHWPAEAQMATGSGGIAATVGTAATWEQALETEAQKLLAGGQPEVWDALTRRFESRLIRTALTATHGRRMEAAQRLGIGRNTITRKIQELGLDAPDEA